MAPSKHWMNLVHDRLSEEYNRGVMEFLDYAFERAREGDRIRCPCVKCFNAKFGSRESVATHLIVYGIMQGYTFWYHHGERLEEPTFESIDAEGIEVEDGDEMQQFLRDLYPTLDDEENEGTIRRGDFGAFGMNEEAEKFYRLLKDSEQPLFDGCKSSKLSVLMKLLHIKTLGQWSNESFTMLLKMLKEDILPERSSLPDSYYESKKTVRDLGLSYIKIDACENNCMLYWKEDANLDCCKVCEKCRWKVDKHSGDVLHKANGKRIPTKTLRYFPLKPRLQRLYMSTKTASFMRWHREKRVDDGILRHPADSMAWKSFDELYKSFAVDPRNVRLGLASDGFQPFANSKTPYSIWPVILIPYNLPPWMIMKPSNFIVSMLIPGPEAPGDAIDVYLRPLIEELKELWEDGVETFDASRRQNFTLHAALLWTINDFPAYGNLSGWSTKGKLACPCCNKDTVSMRLVNGAKQCYMGHRRWLPFNHRWRHDKDSFDGMKETRGPPRTFSGYDILDQVQDLEGINLTKAPNRRVKISHELRGDNWNKRSRFFDLPYWKTLLLRHNLDVMHIEKNICDNVVGTIMDINGKTKDTVKTRLDLQVMHIRRELHPIQQGNKLLLPPAPYTLSPKEKHEFCLFLKQLKVPDGFSSNISHCVNINERKISGLKSHDCHVLLQHLLPLAIRGILPQVVCEPLIELSMFFKILCSKELKADDLDQIEGQMCITLCKLEKIFPPAFFDIMVHLPIHLANEAKMGGPVQYRWMYPIERFLHELKSYIRNRTHPEGSIAEGYIASECMTFCSRYLHGIETKFNKIERNYDGGGNASAERFLSFSQVGRPLGGGKIRDLSIDELEQAHIYIIKNCQEVKVFFEEYNELLRNNSLQISAKDWDTHFIKWFKTKVARLYKTDQSQYMEDLLSLSRGPSQCVTCYNGYIIKGYRFHTMDHDKSLRTQNSGVVVVGDDGVDIEPVDYYGVLREIVELQFHKGRRLVLFCCDWCDVYDKVKGVKIDEYGFVSVNLQRQLKTNEPFVLASQASQVFYVKDRVNKNWHVAIKTQPRDVYALAPQESGEFGTNDG